MGRGVGFVPWLWCGGGGTGWSLPHRPALAIINHLASVFQFLNGLHPIATPPPPLFSGRLEVTLGSEDALETVRRRVAEADPAAVAIVDDQSGSSITVVANSTANGGEEAAPAVVVTATVRDAEGQAVLVRSSL